MLIRRNRLSLILVLFLVASTSVATARPALADVADADARVKLDAGLQQLEDRARQGRYLGGGTLIATGAIAVGVGIGVAATPGADPGGVALSLGLGGGLVAGLGVLVLALPTEYELLPRAYFALPTSNAQDLHARVLNGETALHTLASKSRTARIVGGVTLVGSGIVIGVVGGVYAGMKPDLLGTNAIIGGSLIGCGVTEALLGSISFFVKSEPETIEDDYNDWKSSSSGSKKASLPVHFGFSPLPGGAAAVAAFDF